MQSLAGFCHDLQLQLHGQRQLAKQKLEKQPVWVASAELWLEHL